MTALARSVGELYRFRELILLLVGRDLKVRYKRSALGMAWTLLNPLLQMIVYTLVFSTIMRIDLPGYPVFLLSGLLPWTLISVGTTSSALSLLMNQGLIRKVAVPQAVYPLSIVASKLVDLLFSLVPLAILAAAAGRPPGASWIAVPAAVLFAVAFAAGLSLLFSSITVFFRDVRHLVDVLFQVWLYLSPVFYPYEYLAKIQVPILRTVLMLNPAAPVVRCFQQAIYEQRLPDGGTFAAAAAAAALSLTAGFLVFSRNEPRHIHGF